MYDDHASQRKTGKPVNSAGCDHYSSDDDRIDAPPAGTPLSLARDGDDLIITAMHGRKHFRRQLMDMGLRPGLQIKVLRASGRGPILISVGETRLGIDRGMAEHIETIPAVEEGNR